MSFQFFKFNFIIGAGLLAYGAYGLYTLPDATDQTGDSTARSQAQVVLIGAAALGAFLLYGERKGFA